MVQMVRLVDDLLDVSRITRNRWSFAREASNWRLFCTMLSSIPGDGRGADRELHITMPSAPTSRRRAVRLTQLSGTCSPTLQIHRTGGQIWLAVERQGSDAIVSCGTPARDTSGQRRTFEMFMQVDRALGQSQGGRYGLHWRSS